MQELLYTILELEEWNRRATCDFCPGLNKAVCQIRTRSKLTDKIVANACACQECKEKFEDSQLPKCNNCGRLETKDNIFRGKHICDCIRNNEDAKAKELPILPHERRPNAFYERQINKLREEKAVAEETIELEREIHEDSMKALDDWYTKYQNTDKAELLKRVIELEKESKQWKEQNKVEFYEKEIAELKKQLEQFTSQQQTTQSTSQIEVKETKKWPWKLRK